MNNQFTYPKEKIRFAILTFFFAQGLCMASWASRIPDFKDVFAAFISATFITDCVCSL